MRIFIYIITIGHIEINKTIGYMLFENTELNELGTEKITITFNYTWSKNFEITNAFIFALSPNASPVILKGIISTVPITDFKKFKDDLIINDDDYNCLKKNNFWLLETKACDYFLYGT